ncbi:DCG1 [Sanghuangporus vaninii]
MSRTLYLLVINPNSSNSVTEGLLASLNPFAPLETHLSFFTAPSHAPSAISDTTTANLTATYCYQDLIDRDAFEQYDGFLVCCFSDHPLTHMLREHLMSIRSSKPVINIFEAAVSHALLLGRRFAIITTLESMKYPLVSATSAFLGGTKSERFVDVLTTGLGVVELREGDKENVESVMKSTAAQAASLGADVLILGCAGMAGMEELVKKGVRESIGRDVHAVDGAKAGVELLLGLARMYTA